jgi:starch phosphorylase
MTVLALRMSSYRNGVSALHGKVSRSMWQPLWQHFLEEEVPIHHITNGIHTSTWVAGKLAQLFDIYLGTMWRTETHNKEMWKSIADIPSDQLWKVHQFYTSELVDFARTYLQNRKGTILSNRQKAYINRFLNPQALTIGFARRFATYKRANLLFRDIGRLKKMLTNPDMPVQIILAGKAHPHDNAGKEIIQSIIHAIKEHGLEDHIVFLEDYSMAIASAMVKGCDIWLNTPRRPHEASGTSGMKAAMNGCLHCSIMDGWWDESYNGDNGFSIGSTEQYASTEDQDRAESLSLYEILEQEIIPTFYNRNQQGIPEKWVEKMKSSIITITPEFSTARMVRDYTRKFYLPALQKYSSLQKNNLHGAKELRNWKKHIYQHWETVSFGTISIQGISHAAIGKPIKVYVEVYTGNLSEKDLLVEVVYGKINAQGDLQHVSKQILIFQGYTHGKAWFEGQFMSEFGGQQGCTVRVLPTHTLLTDNADIGLCTWAKQQ